MHTKFNVMCQTVLWIPTQLEHCYSHSQGQAHQNLNTKEQTWTWAVVQPRWEICYPDNMQETDDVEFWDSISSLLFVSTKSSWSGSTGFRITSIETPVLYSVGHTLALIIAVIHHGSSALRELSHPCVKAQHAHACVPVHPKAVQTINITGVLLSHFSLSFFILDDRHSFWPFHSYFDRMWQMYKHLKFKVWITQNYTRKYMLTWFFICVYCLSYTDM